MLCHIDFELTLDSNCPDEPYAASISTTYIPVDSNHGNLYVILFALVLGSYGLPHSEVNGRRGDNRDMNGDGNRKGRLAWVERGQELVKGEAGVSGAGSRVWR